MNYFGTLFDKNYLARGLALRYSLRKTNIQFVLYVLCLDQATFDYFTNEAAADTVPVLLTEVEEAFPELLPAKNDRNWAEYIFTLSPFWPLFLLKRFTSIPYVATLDADIYFFSDPAPIFEMLDEHDILVTPHRFPDQLKHKLVYGRYNVGFQVFKRSEIAFACLERWANQCAVWCYDRKEKTKFADQKYLDEWQGLYHSAFAEIDHIGVGIAPWNMKDVEIKRRDGHLFVHGHRVIFVHFHLLRFMSFHLVKLGLHEYHVEASLSLIRHIYGPYVQRVQHFMQQLGDGTDKMVRNQKKQSRNHVFKMFMEGRIWYFTQMGTGIRMLRAGLLFFPKLVFYKKI